MEGVECEVRCKVYGKVRMGKKEARARLGKVAGDAWQKAEASTAKY